MQSTQSFYLAPGNLDLAVVAGPDAVKLLQGQLTCDVQALVGNSFTRGAACNNKGRIYATFVLVRHADTFFLVFNQGVGSCFAVALKKFLPFYKCSLELAPIGWACLAATGTAAIRTLETEIGNLPTVGSCTALSTGWLCRLAEEQVLLCTGSSEHAALLRVMPDAIAARGSESWQLCELLAGHFPFTPDDVEKYTPQELRLDQHGYISFSKGCYTGQEIVARMHYRGKVKKQLYLLSTPAGTSNKPGGEFVIRNEQGVVAGSPVKQFLADSGTLHVLAQLPVELAEQPASLHDGNGHRLSIRVF